MKPEFRKQEQKQFIEKVAALKLSPHELIFEKRDGDSYQFRYIDSGILFVITPTESRFDKFIYEYTLYTPNRRRVQYIDKPYHLVDILNTFDKWLREHVIAYIEEKAAPDPWELFVKEFSEHDGSEKFTAEEIKRLEEGLNNFPKFLSEKTTIQTDKQNQILEEIEELKKDLHTKSKRKWAKRLMLFLMEEVWDAVKDELIMNDIKKYFFELVSNSAEYIPKLLTLLLP